MPSVVFQPPFPAQKSDRPSLFLAGSIDMDKAEKWQEKAILALSMEEVDIYNPRRKDWNSGWKQSVDEPQFKQQVEWELDHLDRADIALFYFDPNGKAPITLMELGLYAGSNKSIVCCPEGFWRKGNVQVVCQRFNIPLFESLDQGLEQVILKLNNFKNNPGYC